MEKEKVRGAEDLERVMSSVFGLGKITRKLSQVLAYVAVKSAASYQEITEIIEDDPEEIMIANTCFNGREKWAL